MVHRSIQRSRRRTRFVFGSLLASLVLALSIGSFASVAGADDDVSSDVPSGPTASRRSRTRRRRPTTRCPTSAGSTSSWSSTGRDRLEPFDDDYKAAANAFVDSLAGTPSHIGAVTFSNSAVGAEPLPRRLGPGERDVLAWAHQRAACPDGFTNWQAALETTTANFTTPASSCSSPTATRRPTTVPVPDLGQRHRRGEHAEEQRHDPHHRCRRRRRRQHRQHRPDHRRWCRSWRAQPRRAPVRHREPGCGPQGARHRTVWRGGARPQAASDGSRLVRRRCGLDVQLAQRRCHPPGDRRQRERRLRLRLQPDRHVADHHRDPAGGLHVREVQLRRRTCASTPPTGSRSRPSARVTSTARSPTRRTSVRSPSTR